MVAYAWGDMSTNIIQPFWAIPLLSVAKLDFREILEFSAMIFIPYSLIVSAAFFIFRAW